MAGAGFKAGSPEEHFAFQHMKSAGEALSLRAQEANKTAEAISVSNERFYNNLALFSGGTLALSVTYLGYLKSLPRPVQHTDWLIGSWIALITCIAGGLFSQFIYGLYMHYCTSRGYLDAKRDKYETDVAEIGKLNLINLRTPAQLEAYKRPRAAAAAECAKNAAREERREKVYFQTWKWFGRIARLGFLTGLSLLLLFAVKNI
jgi:hypothetical protein